MYLGTKPIFSGKNAGKPCFWRKKKYNMLGFRFARYIIYYNILYRYIS
jgi:hypothetical protein